MLFSQQQFTVIRIYDLTDGDNSIECQDAEFVELGSLEVSGTGRLQVFNTGGSSASEGGLGSDSKTETEKGEITQRDEVDEEREKDHGFDPIKKHIEEKEKEQ